MSKSSVTKLIAKVEDMSLVFRSQIHQSWSLRDVFVKIMSDPVGYFLNEAPRLVVADQLNFEIRSGDRLGLMGVNGVGKTSVCRCIAGMYTPTAGKVSVFGEVRAVFDTAVGIQPELTGRENARLLAEFIYPGAKDLDQILEQALLFSELGSFLDTPYKFYSNGMQTRLSLSLVSAKPCDLLILDEVFDGADVFFREKISRRVLDIIAKSGAVIFVSHQPEQIERVCNRVIVYSSGKVAYDGEVKAGLEFFKTLAPKINA
jgi:ABC-type polysaccharide/polyol phosphate transport system ATPase subunit